MTLSPRRAATSTHAREIKTTMEGCKIERNGIEVDLETFLSILDEFEEDDLEYYSTDGTEDYNDDDDGDDDGDDDSDDERDATAAFWKDFEHYEDPAKEYLGITADQSVLLQQKGITYPGTVSCS